MEHLLGNDTRLRWKVDPNTQVASESSGAQRNKLRETVASLYVCPIPLQDGSIYRSVQM
jgi:hypothetical protein